VLTLHRQRAVGKRRLLANGTLGKQRLWQTAPLANRTFGKPVDYRTLLLAKVTFHGCP
jgi:hypothetical protein